MIEIDDRVVTSEPEEKPTEPSEPETLKPDLLDEQLCSQMLWEGCPNHDE